MPGRGETVRSLADRAHRVTVECPFRHGGRSDLVESRIGRPYGGVVGSRYGFDRRCQHMHPSSDRTSLGQATARALHRGEVGHRLNHRSRSPAGKIDSSLVAKQSLVAASSSSTLIPSLSPAPAVDSVQFTCALGKSELRSGATIVWLFNAGTRN